MHSAEPFFFPGGTTGCLLIHGFTGTPKEMLWMGQYLSKRGYTVLGIRLAGHATDPEDMRRARWWDWIASVEDGITILKGMTRQVYTIGLSMGGILSLIAARRYAIQGAIAISTPYQISDWRLPFIRPLSFFIRKVGKGAPDWQNPEAASDHAEYPYYPTTAILQLRELLAEMRSGLAEIKIPVLLVHSRMDRSVAPVNMDKIYEALTTLSKHKLLVEHSGHVILREPDREQVYQAAVKFIEHVTMQK